MAHFKLARTTPVRLLYSVRSDTEVIGRPELAPRPELDVTLSYTRAAPPGWTGPTGIHDWPRRPATGAPRRAWPRGGRPVHWRPRWRPSGGQRRCYPGRAGSVSTPPPPASPPPTSTRLAGSGAPYEVRGREWRWSL